MRIPIEALKEFAKKYKHSHVVVMARDEDGKQNHVATYGKTVEQCSQAADFGNRLKDALGWPESLHRQPLRLRHLQARIRALENALKPFVFLKKLTKKRD